MSAKLSMMDLIKIGGFLVTFGTFLLLGLSLYDSFKGGQAAVLAELRGVRVAVEDIGKRVDRVEGAVFPMQPATTGRR